MHLSRTVFEINGDFGRKSQIIHILRVFNAPLMGFSLEFCDSEWAQKIRMKPGTRASKFVTMCLFI